ncbi:porin family protein [Providencia sneebia]|uniref:Uncharacterized protein n=1 Tax=Providencia sneebia DSM 19967 TaxID=1141660 RepID=K8WXM7_9GAMM|nr:porin family protein [Providencia sneebia]EKT60955.1 hypothetical protein OO7_02661 [Providencia sneebia DSM 19967]
MQIAPLFSIIIIFISSLMPLTLYSANIDTDRELLLWQKEQQINRENNNNIPDKNQSLLPDDAILKLDGKTYSVKKNINDLGKAIYLSITQHQFDDIQQLLNHYQYFPDHDPLLVLFAHAEIEKYNNHYSQAINYYREILELSPNFLRVKLELARTYFEDKQNNESLKIFNNIINDTALLLPESTRHIIQKFIITLEKRISWSGNFSVAYTYNSNINQTPKKNKIWEIPGGVWQTEAPIAYGGLSYDASLDKAIPLFGHHSLQIKASSYGDHYPHYAEFSENTSTLATLYQFNNADTTLSFGPQIELKTIDNQHLHTGIGLRIESDYQFSPRFMVSASANYHWLNYQKTYAGSDGSRSNLLLTGIYGLTTDTSLFLGTDATQVTTQTRSDDYDQLGLRSGFFSVLSPDIHLLTLATLRYSQFQAFNSMLNVKRDDREAMLFTRLSFPGYSVLTLTPYTSYRFRDNQSSADGIYSYRQHEFSAGFETRF